jgi:hypothetical protein
MLIRLRWVMTGLKVQKLSEIIYCSKIIEKYYSNRMRFHNQILIIMSLEKKIQKSNETFCSYDFVNFQYVSEQIIRHGSVMIAKAMDLPDIFRDTYGHRIRCIVPAIRWIWMFSCRQTLGSRTLDSRSTILWNGWWACRRQDIWKRENDSC